MRAVWISEKIGMSALGQKWKSHVALRESALPPKADMLPALSIEVDPVGETV